MEHLKVLGSLQCNDWRVGSRLRRRQQPLYVPVLDLSGLVNEAGGRYTAIWVVRCLLGVRENRSLVTEGVDNL